jgi:hypothetical protein
MLPMTTPAVPGTTIEPDISMDVRMNASVPSARVSIETGTVDCMELSGCTARL